DKVTLSQQGDDAVLRCTDGAVVVYKDMRVEADWIELNPVTKQITAGDKVHFVRGDQQVDAERIDFNLETKTGKFIKASGLIEGFHIQSEDSERLADGQWYFTKPTATACAADCPVWHLTWKDVTVRPGKTIAGKGMAFRLRNIPVFYVPRFTLPTESR